MSFNLEAGKPGFDAVGQEHLPHQPVEVQIRRDERGIVLPHWHNIHDLLRVAFGRSVMGSTEVLPDGRVRTVLM